jgi:hypothetical protein
MTPTEPTTVTLAQAEALGAFLHRKGVGCDGHEGDSTDIAVEMHRDDAYDILHFLPAAHAALRALAAKLRSLPVMDSGEAGR